jgi:hypothetical protein
MGLAVLSKNHAAPKTWVPAESGPANHRCRGYDYRCRSNHGDPRYDHDWASIRTASSVRPGMKTWAAAACSNDFKDATKAAAPSSASLLQCRRPNYLPVAKNSLATHWQPATGGGL